VRPPEQEAKRRRKLRQNEPAQRCQHSERTLKCYEERTRQVQAAENRHGIDSAELKTVRDEQNALVFASCKQDRTEWHDAIVQRLLEHADAGEQRTATHLLHRLHRQKRKRKRRAQPQKDCYTQQELGSLHDMSIDAIRLDPCHEAYRFHAMSLCRECPETSCKQLH
jgi:hypothetical protein